MRVNNRAQLDEAKETTGIIWYYEDMEILIVGLRGSSRPRIPVPNFRRADE